MLYHVASSWQTMVFVLLSLAACWSSIQPAVPLPRSTPIISPPSTPPTPPRTAADRDNDFVRAWTAWTAGKRLEATRTFRTLLDELGTLPATSDVRAPGVSDALIAVSSDGTRGVVLRGGGAYWFDGTGAPLRYEVAEASSVEFLPGTSLAVLGGADLAIVDGVTFTRVLHATNVSGWRASPSGNLVVYEDTANALARIHVWDVSTKTELRAFDLRAEESATSFGFSPDEKEIFFHVFAHAGDDQLALVDEAGRRLDFPQDFDSAAPSFSTDGRYVAYAYALWSGSNSAGKTVLIDRRTRREVASTGASDYPTATQFSKSGKYLVVGDLRRLSIMEVPLLRVLATTPYLRDRSRYGGDDMQNITSIEILGADAAFWAETADGTSGVFRLPAGTLVWKGRGARSIDAAGVQRFDGRYEDGQLVTVDAHFAVSQRALTTAESNAPEPWSEDAADKLRTLLERTVCSLHGRVFPISACR